MSFVSTVACASKAEVTGHEFTAFMTHVSAFASERMLSQHLGTSSKRWEYPWAWFNALKDVEWPGTRLLDIGSSASPMPWLLASLGASVTIVERSLEYARLWKAIVEVEGYEVSWKIVPTEQLPFDDGVFDVVTSFSVIEHQPTKEAAVGEAIRVLKPGGLLVMSFDLYERELGMTFPSSIGEPLSRASFERLVWRHPQLTSSAIRMPAIDLSTWSEFGAWHAAGQNDSCYVVGAACLVKKSLS